MSEGNGPVHHHGPLAGISAGVAAVLFAFGVLALAWHRVAGQVSLAVTVLAYAVIFAVAGLACAVLFYAVLWLRHRALHPELLAGRRQAVTAQVVGEELSRTGAQPLAPLPYAGHAAIEPPRVVENHFHFPDAGTAAAAVRAMRDGELEP